MADLLYTIVPVDFQTLDIKGPLTLPGVQVPYFKSMEDVAATMDVTTLDNTHALLVCAVNKDSVMPRMAPTDVPGAIGEATLPRFGLDSVTMTVMSNGELHTIDTTKYTDEAYRGFGMAMQNGWNAMEAQQIAHAVMQHAIMHAVHRFGRQLQEVPGGLPIYDLRLSHEPDLHTPENWRTPSAHLYETAFQAQHQPMQGVSYAQNFWNTFASTASEKVASLHDGFIKRFEKAAESNTDSVALSQAGTWLRGQCSYMDKVTFDRVLHDFNEQMQEESIDSGSVVDNDIEEHDEP